MKNLKYFIRLILLITVFTFTNCQKEEFLPEPVQSKNELVFHQIRYVYADEINQNTSLTKTICDIVTNRVNGKSNSFSRTIYNEEYNFEINTDLAKYMESVDGTFHSYTFPIIQGAVTQGTMDNLVLYSVDGSDYMAKLIKYNLSESQLEQFEEYDHIDTDLELQVIDLEGNFNDYLLRGDNGCNYDIKVEHLTPGPEGQLFEFGEGSTCHHIGDCDIFVTITVSCGPESPSGSSGAPNGSTGSNTGNTGTGNNPNTGNGNAGGSSAGNSNGLNSPGSSSQGTVIGSAPVSVYYYKKGVVNTLGLNNADTNDANLISWLGDNVFELLEVSLLLDENRDANGEVPLSVKNDIEAALRVISGLEVLNSLTTISMNKVLMKIIGGSLDSLSPIVFGEQKEAWSNIDQDDNLGLGDWVIVAAKGLALYTDFKINGINFDKTKAELDSAFIALLSNVKSMVGENWPQTVEQWNAIGTIMGQFLVEIGIAFIPGSDIIDVVSGLDEGDYVAVTLGFAGLLVDAFGGTILKAIGKVGKFAYKTFKIFKIVFRYLDEVVDAITLGLKANLVDGAVRITDEFDRLIAKIFNNVLTVKYTGFGGDIVTNPNKTTTVIGRSIDPSGGGTIDIIESGLSKSGRNEGGLNVLHETLDPSWNEQQIWNNINEPWLNESIIAGDVIRVVSNPLKKSNVFKNTVNLNQIPNNAFIQSQSLSDYLLNLTTQQVNDLSFYGKEIRHLFQNGYTYNSVTNQFIL